MAIAVYDKAKWHSQHSTFPLDVPEHGAFLYGGFFLAWAFLAGLIAEEELDGAKQVYAAIASREGTPTTAYQAIDGALTEDQLSAEGNAFAAYCFDTSSSFDYYLLFEESLANGLPSPYQVPDTWETFDLLKLRLDAAYQEWKEARPAQPV